ncbi:carbonic anhydrase 1-like [Culex pipiens pallens]|uniref:carbonic anhydrase 1-like n=1 Tax=Culex pipiens pallens TaxID=42434 RepID=UPI001954959B|nr:carbonic anhydrase 1-like [Culex pipiens pallens]
MQYSFSLYGRMMISLVILLEMATSLMNDLFENPTTKCKASSTPLPPSLPPSVYDYAYGESIQEWGDISAFCNGKLQSPIALYTKSSMPVANVPPLFLSGSRQNPKKVTVQNTGKTVMYEFEFLRPIIARGAALDGEFQFNHIHFHWGSTSNEGAEHEVNGQRFPLEMHLVFFNKIYGTIEKAMPSSNGLAVIGVIFQIDERSNVTYPWLTPMANVRLAGTIYKLPNPAAFNVDALIGSTRTHYFSYKGSLTNPPCYETVTWMVMRKRLPVREDQLATFRALLQSYGQPLVNNHRPLRELNGRRVLLYRGSV